MFVSTTSHILDTKGRIIVPARYREQLGNHPVLCRGLDECLDLYPREVWEENVRFLRGLSPFDEDARLLLRFYYGGCDDTIEVDRQGRMLISPFHRGYAGLDKDVLLVGVGDHIEIWNKERYEARNTFSNISEIAQRFARTHTNHIE